MTGWYAAPLDDAEALALARRLLMQAASLTNKECRILGTVVRQAQDGLAPTPLQQRLIRVIAECNAEELALPEEGSRWETQPA